MESYPELELNEDMWDLLDQVDNFVMDEECEPEEMEDIISGVVELTEQNPISDVFACGHCTKEYKTLVGYDRHMQTKHTPAPKLELIEIQNCFDLSKSELLKENWPQNIKDEIESCRLEPSAIETANLLLSQYRKKDVFQTYFDSKMPGNLSLNTKLRARTLITREMGKFILALLKKKITPNVIKTSDKQDFLEKKEKDVIVYVGGFCFATRFRKYSKVQKKKFEAFKTMDLSLISEGKKAKCKEVIDRLQMKVDILKSVKIESSDNPNYQWTISRQRTETISGEPGKGQLWLISEIAVDMFEAIEFELRPFLNDFPAKDLSQKVTNLVQGLFNESVLDGVIGEMKNHTSADDEEIHNILEDVVFLFIRVRVHRYFKDFNLKRSTSRTVALRTELKAKYVHKV